MAATDTAGQAERGWYIYGILRSDVEVAEGATGIGSLGSPLELVQAGDLAALISEVDIEALGKPQDIMAHQELLDDVAGAVPVLPFRFGAVVSERDAVSTDLLLPYHDQFLDALAELSGRVQYLVRARYAEGPILREVLDGTPELRAMQQEIRELPEEASLELRIELGGIIGSAVESRRCEDTRYLVDELAACCVAVAEREPAHPLDAARVALLVEDSEEEHVQKVVKRIADEWAGRVEVRQQGPMAPYDFVPLQPEED